MEAGVIAAQMTDDVDVICAAILHDVMEDAGVTVAELTEAFNEKVAHLVEHETEDKSKGWLERKSATLESLKDEEDQDVLLMMLSDKLSNIRAIHRDFVNMGDNLWERFNVKDKEMQGWYYKGLAEGMGKLENYPEYLEFCELVKKVFG